MEALLEQITVKKFKPSNFTVYNIVEDKGFITELEGMFNKRFSIENFEYMVVDLTIKETNGLLYYMSSIMNRINDLKKLIEVQIQDDPLKPMARVYVNNEKGYVFIFKLKEFDLIERILKTKIGDKHESLSPIDMDV